MPGSRLERRGVSSIRPLVRADLEQVARLHAADAGVGDDAGRVRRIADFFERTLLAYPWADPKLPSLVYQEDGRVLGFLGSNVRRMRFDGRPVRMACSAHLIADPSVRSKAVGARLLKTYLDGPQDLTITDGANETVRRMWEGLGGQTVHVSSLTFVRVLRPLGLAAHRGLSTRAPSVERALTSVTRVVDAAAVRAFDRPAETDARTEELTPRTLLDHLVDVAGGDRLVPDYDAEYLSWLFAELGRVGSEQVFVNRIPRGSVVADVVWREDECLGWYVTQLRPRGLCRVLQLAAKPRASGEVFDCLARRAYELGASGIYGRLEPHLVGSLSERRALLRFSDGRFLVHARDQELVDVVLRGQALVTRFDGEWW
jgi:hypothetical protein